MEHISIYQNDHHIMQDDAYEFDRIKALIIQGNYIEAIVFASEFNSQDDSLDIKQFINFTIDQACELLQVSKRTMFEYIKAGKIKAVLLVDCQCYISLQSLVDYLRTPTGQ